MEIRFMEIDDDGALTLTRGDDEVCEVQLFDSDNSPLDLTGCAFLAQVRSKIDGYVVFEFEIESTGLSHGVITLRAPHDVTSVLRIREGVWDLQVTWPNGDVETLVAPAAVTIDRDVSR